MTQDEALALLKTGASVFLTGQPGSGKTHTVNRYIQWLKRQGIEFAYTASTGIAATHGHGTTIHAWSGIGVRETLNARDLDTLAANRRLATRIERTQVLVIDEISMLPARSLTLVDMVCRHIRGVPSPFGGLQVVLVGDFFQLPPVVRREAQAGDAAARRRRGPVRRGVRPCLLGLARSCTHRLLSVRAAPAERQAVSRSARRDPRQCLHRHSSRAARRAAGRQGSPARGLHAAVHA